MSNASENALIARSDLLAHLTTRRGFEQLRNWGQLGMRLHPESHTGTPLEEEVPALLEEAELYLVGPAAAEVIGEASRHIPAYPVPSGPSDDGRTRGDLPSSSGYIHFSEPLDLSKFTDPTKVEALETNDPTQIWDPQIKTLKGILWSTTQEAVAGEMRYTLSARPFYEPAAWAEMTGLIGVDGTTQDTLDIFQSTFDGAPLMPGTPDILSGGHDETASWSKPGDPALEADYQDWGAMSKGMLRWLIPFGAICQSAGERSSVPRPAARRLQRSHRNVTQPKWFVVVDLPGYTRSASDSPEASDGNSGQQFGSSVVGHFRTVPIGPRIDKDTGEVIDVKDRDSRLTWIHPHLRRPDLPIRPKVHRVNAS